MFNISLIQTFYCPEYSRQHSSKQKYYFGFFVAPTYTYFMCLFSPGWHFKTSSKSRLPNSMVVKSCPCSLLKLFICYYMPLLGRSRLFPEGRLRPALTFSCLWISLSRMCFHLLQGCTHNCCKADFEWIFSNKSITPFPSLLPLTSFSVVFPFFLTTTNSITHPHPITL